MLKRTLVFSSPMHLSLRNAQLVVSTKEATNEQRTVPIEDIGLVMVENQMVTVTMPLLNALVDSGVAVILCDAKGKKSRRNPCNWSFFNTFAEKERLLSTSYLPNAPHNRMKYMLLYDIGCGLMMI